MKRLKIQTKEEWEKVKIDFNWKCFSFDTETTSLDYYSQEMIGMSFCDGNITFYTPYKDYILKDLKILISKDCSILAHNIVFDAKVLHKYNVSIFNSQWIDTMVMSHLLNENEEHGLKYLANKYLGVDIKEWKDITKNTDSEEYMEYALNDAEWTWLLAQEFKQKIIDEDLFMLFSKIEMPFLRCLFLMEITGIKVDKERIDITTKELKKVIIDLEIQMLDSLNEPYEYAYDLFGEFKIKSKLNFNSSIQLAKIIKERLGLDIEEKTESGKESVGKVTIKKLKEQHEFVKLLDKYKAAQKLLSAFFEPMPDYIDEDGRIRPSFKDIGAKTGRLSCHSPNLQQLPKKNENFDEVDVRSCFVASEGYVMIAGDYSGQELRVLAQVTDDNGLIDAFNSGKDFHQETADKFGVSRTKAKAINFGVAYRKSAYGFAKDWGTTEEEAQEFLDKYFEQFPNVLRKMSDTDKFLNSNDYVKSLTGRRRRFEKVTKNNWTGHLRGSYRQAFNFLVQGFSADMMRIACVKVMNLGLRNKEWGLKMLMTVHDELVVEVKEEYKDIALVGIKEVMESAVKFKVPVIADVKYGKNYSECK